VLRIRAIAVASALGASLVGIGLTQPGSALGGDSDPVVVAFLDGRAIPVADVSRHFCDDFSYPTIHCSSSPLVIELRATSLLLLTGADYVTVYEKSSFQGTYMNVSQDYGSLLTIGWNDRISSFKARNSETGRFWTDWFNGGTVWNFCCNTWVSSLGSYDNTFSSMQRT
jgi:hypothetical protein